MDRLPHLWRLLADETKILIQFSWRIECLLALIALISPCIRELTVWTGADNEAISKPKVTVGTVTLGHLLLSCLLLLVDIEEDLLGYF